MKAFDLLEAVELTMYSSVARVVSASVRRTSSSSSHQGAGIPVQNDAVAAADEQIAYVSRTQDKEFMDFPGGKVPFTSSLQFQGSEKEPMNCYRTIDGFGCGLEEAAVPHPIGKGLIARLLVSVKSIRQTSCGLSSVLMFCCCRPITCAIYVPQDGAAANARHHLLRSPTPGALRFLLSCSCALSSVKQHHDSSA
jgi:hypothetical protein